MIKNDLQSITRPSWINLASRNAKVRSGYLALDRNENQDEVYRNQIANIIKTHVDLEKTSQYVDYYDTYQLLSEFYSISTDNILITAGCDEAMRLTFEATLDSSKRLGYAMPTYRGVVNNSADLTSNICRDFNEHPDVYYICSPNNPDGNVIGAGYIEWLLKDNPDTLIFLDNTYGDYCDERYDYLIKYENIVIGKSYSKSWGLAGARFGFILAHSNIITQIAKIRPIMSVSSITLQLVDYLLMDNTIVQHTILRNVEGIYHAHKYFGNVKSLPTINSVMLDYDPSLADELHKKRILFGHDESTIKITTMPSFQFDRIFK